MKHFTIISALLITFASSAFAVDPADLQKLKDTRACVNCDLSNAYQAIDTNGDLYQ